MVCGHHSLWPSWFVAIMVCGRHGLWPSWFVAIMVVAIMVRRVSHSRFSPMPADSVLIHID